MSVKEAVQFWSQGEILSTTDCRQFAAYYYKMPNTGKLIWFYTKNIQNKIKQRGRNTTFAEA